MEIDYEIKKFESWCKIHRPHVSLSLRHDGLKKEYEDFMANNLLDAWLAAKQDAKGQLK